MSLYKHFGMNHPDNQKTRVVHLNKEPYDVLIDRRTEFGNPFPVSQHGRKRCLALYKVHFYNLINNNPEFKRKIHALKGKTLGCWCKPEACHGDIIAEYLENLPKE